jgi:hypothetical protein
MFIRDWKKVLKKAWSIRFNILGIILGAVELALPILDQIYVIPRGYFLVASVLAMVCGNVARLMSQKEFRNDEQS